MNPVIIPYVNNPSATADTLQDALAQTGVPDLHVLLIDQSSDPTFGAQARVDDRLSVWRQDPPLPSLSACWNRALQWAWEAGAKHALVINNDIRMCAFTYQYLVQVQAHRDALFVSATGVDEAGWEKWNDSGIILEPSPWMPHDPLPGPDFSCYLITKGCHERYPFDEHYIPGYVEDIDTHRRMMLGGDGRKIFGTGLPFLHLGSGTLNAMTAEQRTKWEERITKGSRAYHRQKWAGDANEETLTRPFDPSSARPGVTTPELFERVRNNQPAIPDVR